MSNAPQSILTSVEYFVPANLQPDAKALVEKSFRKSQEVRDLWPSQLPAAEALVRAGIFEQTGRNDFRRVISL